MVLLRWRHPEHRGWAAFCLLVALVFIGAYAYSCLHAKKWLTGSSAVCFAAGVAAAFIFLYELWIYAKKRNRRRARTGSTRRALVAHVWLGLLTVPLVVVHTGFYLGGWLPTLLLLAYVIVAGSGVVGLYFQNTLPRSLHDRVEFETVYSEIDSVRADLAREAAQAFTRGAERTPAVTSHSQTASSPFAAGFVVEDLPAYAAHGDSHATDRSADAGAARADAEDRRRAECRVLESFYDESLAPLLAGFRAKDIDLASGNGAERAFFALRRRTNTPEARDVIDRWEAAAAQWRDLKLQRRLHLRLHRWILWHVSLTATTFVLLAAHVVTALWYW